MSSQSGVHRTLRVVLLGTMLCLCMGGRGNPDGGCQSAPSDVVQFDATIELNAPLVKSHVVLFVRYWVAPTSYRIAVLWAEPHAPNLNFPMHPVTMVVDSNEQGFSIANQVQSTLGRTFRKPIGERGVFRHRLNSYAIGDLRFTETEALAARLYRGDLRMLPPWTADGLATLEIRDRPAKGEVKRDAAALDLHVANNHVDTVEIVDANHLLIKRIAYHYSQEQGRDILSGQEVLLPERPLLLGYGERGVIIRVNGQERTFKELYGLDHEGGRRCSVEYEPVRTRSEVRPMPAHIVVQRADNGTILRTARMSHFLLRTQTPAEVERTATQAGRFSHEELRVRALSAKHWSADPNQTAGEDAKALQPLREHFKTSVPNEAIGEGLRRTHMLMELDWLQGSGLLEHFGQYLTILTANGLDEAAFIGGLNVIDTAVRRRQYAVADQLLTKWADHAAATTEAEMFLTFAQAQLRKGHFWAIARLLQYALQSGKGWGSREFDALALRCISLHGMLEVARDPSKKTLATAKAQMAWASRSLALRDLLSMANESLADARRLYSELAQPDDIQRALRSELDRIDGDMRKGGYGAPDRDRITGDRSQNNETEK